MIIGLQGKAGAGKDAFADRLVAKHGFVKRGFATPLYEEVARAWKVTPDWLADRSRKEVPQGVLQLACCFDQPFFDFVLQRGWNISEPRSPRWLLQHWGTEYRRMQNMNYWLDQMRAFCDKHPDVVIIDTRFENEAQWVRDAGGVMVSVHRPGLTAVEGEHVSAAGLPASLIDFKLPNEGSLTDWVRRADSFIDYLRSEMAVEAGG